MIGNTVGQQYTSTVAAICNRNQCDVLQTAPVICCFVAWDDILS